MDDAPLIKLPKVLPKVQKLPTYITWVFSDRNRRIDAKKEIQEKLSFNKEDDYLLLNTIQQHGLSETVLNYLSEVLQVKDREIKARYDFLLMQDKKKDNITLPQGNRGYVDKVAIDGTVDLEKGLEVAMDTYNILFCRQCLVFDCQLHDDSRNLVFPSEKQRPMMPSEEDCNTPCGIHCHKLQAAIDDDLSARNLCSDAPETTYNVSESMDWNDSYSRTERSPPFDKPGASNGCSKFWHCKSASRNSAKGSSKGCIVGEGVDLVDHSLSSKSRNDDPKTSSNSTIKTEINRKGMEPKNHSQANFLRGLDDGGWSTLEKDLYAKGVQIFGRNSCLIAVNLLGGLKTCAEIAEYMHCKDALVDCSDFRGMEVQTRKTFELSKMELRPRPRAKREAIPGRNLLPHYTPCMCQSACGDGCPCIQNKTYCEKYCGCSKTCKKRFRGCRCVKSQCGTRNCPCFAAERECDPDICQNCWIGCGDGSLGYPPPKGGYYKCENMKILQIKKQQVLLGRSDISGWGIFAKENVQKNEYIGEYTGELISHEEAEKRGRIYDTENSSFLFDLNKEYVVDARRMGSKMKFLNHSSTPNCYPKVIMVRGDHRIGIFAKTNIQAGEELLFDYGYQPKARPAWMKNPEHPHPKEKQARSDKCKTPANRKGLI